MAEVSKSASGTAHGNTVTFNRVRIVFQVFPGIKGTDVQRGIAGVPYTLSTDGGKTVIKNAVFETTTDGSVTFLVPSNTPAILKIFDTEYQISALSSIEPKTTKKGVQSRLSLLGYELGDIDGKLGSKSDRSLLNFQADTDLNCDGKIDALTQNRLATDFGE